MDGEARNHQVGRFVREWQLFGGGLPRFDPVETACVGSRIHRFQHLGREITGNYATGEGPYRIGRVSAPRAEVYYATRAKPSCDLGECGQILALCVHLTFDIGLARGLN